MKLRYKTKRNYETELREAQKEFGVASERQVKKPGSSSNLQKLPESVSSLPLRSNWFFRFRRTMEFHTFLRLMANIDHESTRASRPRNVVQTRLFLTDFPTGSPTVPGN